MGARCGYCGGELDTGFRCVACCPEPAQAVVQCPRCQRGEPCADNDRLVARDLANVLTIVAKHESTVSAMLAALAARVLRAEERLTALECEYSGPNWKATILAHDARISALEDRQAPAQPAPLPAAVADAVAELMDQMTTAGERAAGALVAHATAQREQAARLAALCREAATILGTAGFWDSNEPAHAMAPRLAAAAAELAGDGGPLYDAASDGGGA